MSNRIPPILMILGGLLIAIAPWIGELKVPDNVLPGPNHEGAWVLIIESAETRTPDLVKLQADPYWGTLEARGLKHRFYDNESPDAKSFKATAEEAGLPALVVTSKDGDLLAAKPCPATSEGVDAIVKEVTGR